MICSNCTFAGDIITKVRNMAEGREKEDMISRAKAVHAQCHVADCMCQHSVNYTLVKVSQ